MMMMRCFSKSQSTVQAAGATLRSCLFPATRIHLPRAPRATTIIGGSDGRPGQHQRPLPSTGACHFVRTISTSQYVIAWQSLPCCTSSPAQPSISFSRIFQKSSRSLPFLSQPVASVRPFLLRIILNVLEAGTPT